ncbi:polysaccharide deacetylase family protein, partial [Luedemannella flava]|uniref:polysaccharide deacetylase family protein n=1 Tax=Luedemannella flava TaxID=349316 RepID=UPI0031D7AA7A
LSRPPTSRPPTSAAAPGTPADYVARLPKFPKPPRPQKVALDHEEGRAALYGRIPTGQKVAFLTIDDGWTKHPEALRLLRAAGVPVTLFLTTDAIRGNVGYFADLRDAGADIEVHTVTHPHLPDLDYDGQRAELCGNADKLKQWYGKRPLYFRPPYGEYDDDTLRAAWDCGLRAGFLWRETVDGGVVRYQTAEKVIRPGDIVLMHFRPAYPEDFIAALTAMKRSGLVPARLTDYVAPVT